MANYQLVTSREGERITSNEDGSINVPNLPIIPRIGGEG